MLPIWWARSCLLPGEYTHIYIYIIIIIIYIIICSSWIDDASEGIKITIRFWLAICVSRFFNGDIGEENAVEAVHVLESICGVFKGQNFETVLGSGERGRRRVATEIVGFSFGFCFFEILMLTLNVVFFYYYNIFFSGAFRWTLRWRI